MFEEAPTTQLLSPARDSVAGLDATEPTIVSISDIHGYPRAARSALLTLSDHPAFDSVVTRGPADRLQWAGGDEFVLVFNGDLFDRGPDSAAVGSMVARLAAQAPDGHVRVTLGNHEMCILTPDRFGWQCWAANRTDDQRRAFVERIGEGLVVAAYEGHSVTYAHAGRTEPYRAGAVNGELVNAAGQLLTAVGTDQDYRAQREIIEAYPAVLGLGGANGREPGAGIAWLDLAHMPADAPPQVVGHTRQDSPRRTGNVVCQDTIRNNQGDAGGEAVVVETPERLVALVRDPQGGVRTRELSLPDA